MDNSPKKILTVGCPNLGNRKLFEKYVSEAFERRWFTNYGMNVQMLERQIADFLKVKHCIAVCNATLGLQVVAQVLELTGEVIVPSFTFVATPHSLKWQGITPCFVDIDPHTHLLNLKAVENAINEKTSAILAVHTWGKACHPDELEKLAAKYNLKLYFDAAHAFACSYKDQMIGSFGDCEVFSFHATKFFNAFEGGAITTNDDELAKKIRGAINFGFTGVDQVSSLGINGKMSEIHAAMGLACFDTINEILDTNCNNYETYKRLLSSIPGIKLFKYDSINKNNYQYIIAEIDERLTKTSRDELVAHLHNHNIIARKYFYPGCHRMMPYAADNSDLLTHTDMLCEKVLSLPNGTNVTLADVEFICNTIKHKIIL